MSDIIQLLPDSIANQIAAGEVVQRPASVVKELMENSIDAQCTSIKLFIKDGGKTLIQVIDDGLGMSETDARMSFERHATSKIREAKDLFALHTMGFRGEALASIAAVAEVELKTRKRNGEIGTLLQICGSQVVAQQPTACPDGSNISVKNLFFNTPARRKFLKSNSVEIKHIISEFQRVALANPNIEVSLNSNDTELYHLPASNLKQRIVGLFGKYINQHLIECETQNSIVNISGFVGKPESSKKSVGEQFFFVNNRYMRNPFLHRAVLNAYSRLIPEGNVPPYFLFLDINPADIDVNIHPTKTEIKFEDERTIWQIVHAATKESLGKFTLAPKIDFDNQVDFDMPFFPKSAPVSPPEIEVNTNYNPFDEEGTKFYHHKLDPNQHAQGAATTNRTSFENTVPNEPSQLSIQTFESKASSNIGNDTSPKFFQLKGRYIITSIASGLMIIDQRRAHIRILFDQFMSGIDAGGHCESQRELYPRTVELKPDEYALVVDSIDQLALFGLEISNLGNCAICVNSLPACLKNAEPARLVEDLILALTEDVPNFGNTIKEKIALSLALASSIGYNKNMSNFEMQELVDRLFACQLPSITPNGKKIIAKMELDEVEKMLR